MTAIRLARAADATAIVDLEDQASSVYRDIQGYAWVDELPPMTVHEVIQAIGDDGVWVAEHENQIVGAVVCWWHDDDCHLRELNVHSEHAGRGLGRRLVETVVASARAKSCARVVLTTFVEIPFNGPWYERLGFVAVDPDELDGWIADERAEEAREGLDRKPRQAMVLALR